MKKKLTYNQMLKKIRDDKNGVTTRNTKKILIENGYFNLVNGYKHLYINTSNPKTNGKHNYHLELCIDEIKYIEQYNDDISSIILKNILIIEKRIASVSSHIFAHYNSPEGYLDINSYSKIKLQGNIVSLNVIAKIYSELSKAQRNSSYIKHYAENILLYQYGLLQERLIWQL